MLKKDKIKIMDTMLKNYHFIGEAGFHSNDTIYFKFKDLETDNVILKDKYLLSIQNKTKNYLDTITIIDQDLQYQKLFEGIVVTTFKSGLLKLDYNVFLMASRNHYII